MFLCFVLLSAGATFEGAESLNMVLQILPIHHMNSLVRVKRQSQLRLSIQCLPARNALLLSVALMSMECDSGIVAIGIHAGTPYVDCSLDFQRRMQNVYDLYTNGSVRIDAPFIQWTKSDIWDYAQMQNVPLNLTYSSNLGDLHPVSQTLRSTL